MKSRLEEELRVEFVEEFDVPEQPTVTAVEPEWSSDGRSWVIEGNDQISFSYSEEWDDRVTPEHIQQVLSSAAAAVKAGGIDRPVAIQIDNPRTIGEPGLNASALGWVNMAMSNHTIHLAAQLFKDYSGGQGKSKFKDTADNQMAALSTLSDVRRVVIHEMGHINDKQMRRESGRSEHMMNVMDAATEWGTSSRMSAYGRSSDVEGYAEAFAEWTATGGKTNNQAVLDYGEMFGWQSWTEEVALAVAAALGLTVEETGDNVIYVMTDDGLSMLTR